ncbi:tannase/feruloyl esterase family alpha/beta hydrolase [Novosphingobium sp. KACC 22771]|uniref:tannase/feruloyl esterase family alpha/beta hydrolase n=1 Tax=Novosphingobium sp. KACC 22771 TaxID=3025670 RepID=UPI0023674074|nr:tannase/feruloyl esterase family alpha/beta hydrolase [Novosphingobium sp. KACC 22771]WDF74505.1 tannase/feruloyl esterase family alpha/beta hydrolase [Novosphingobium sp. KACC 22771]
MPQAPNIRLWAIPLGALCFGLSTPAMAAPYSLAADPARRCLDLAPVSIPAARLGEPSAGAKVVSAQYHRAGEIKLQGLDGSATFQTPDYCEVRIDILPLDPKAPPIHSQVNLPFPWNGKKLQFGGSGYNGFLQTGVQPSRNAPIHAQLPLNRGYMTAGTDSGHQITISGGGDQRGSGASAGSAGDDPRAASARQYAFAANDEALRNFGYAAYKKTHDAAVALGFMFYGRKPSRSYYLGGSEGGREAMTMAQRYPGDYDGIIAIDPVMNWTGLQTFSNHIGGQLQAVPDGWLGAKTGLLAQIVRDTCDSADGIADKVISAPTACLAPAAKALASHRCPTGRDEGPACFSDAQLAVLRAAHRGYDFPFPLANGVTHYAGYLPGSEDLPGAWSKWEAGTTKPTAANPDDPSVSRLYQLGSVYVRHFIALDAGFNTLTYDPRQFQKRVLEVSRIMDATNPDLRAFHARGGKLILREDLADSGQGPFNSLQYRDAVARLMGQKTTDAFFAAYVATGLPHTSGGIDPGTPGAPAYGIPGRIDLLDVLEDWVERGRKPGAALILTLHDPAQPERVTASKPMCRYGTWPFFTGQPGEGANGSKYECRPR